MRILGLAVCALVACGGGDDDGGGGDPLALTSTAFDEGGAIPVRHTCEGADVSPQLAWTGGPEAAGYAVILVDETNGLIHFVLWDIAGDVTSLREDIAKEAEPAMPDGAKQAAAWDGATRGWLGPCPDEVHDYVIRLYALDERPLTGVTLDTGRTDLVGALEDHQLAHADLRGSFAPQ